VAIPADRNVVQKEAKKKVTIQEFMYRDTKNVELEMYDYTSNNWSQWNSNEKLKEKFGSCIRKTFDRFTTKDSRLECAVGGVRHPQHNLTGWFQLFHDSGR
jgi:hypothetical protein